MSWTWPPKEPADEYLSLLTSVGVWRACEKNYLILHIAGHKPNMVIPYFNLPPQLCPNVITLFLSQKELAPLRRLGQGLPVHTVSNISQHLCSKWLHQQVCCSTKVPPHLRQWKSRASTTVKPIDVIQPHTYLNTPVKMSSKPQTCKLVQFQSISSISKGEVGRHEHDAKKQRAEMRVVPTSKLNVTTSQIHDMRLPQIQSPRG